MRSDGAPRDKIPLQNPIEVSDQWLLGVWFGTGHTLMEGCFARCVAVEGFCRSNNWILFLSFNIFQVSQKNQESAHKNLFEMAFLIKFVGEKMGEVKCHGFTLVESMFVIFIMVILVAMAIPDLSDFGHSTRLSAYSNKFLAVLVLTRSEAIKRNSWVAVCKSNDGQSCAPDGNWSQGWIVFADLNNNVQHEPVEQLLQMEAAMPANWTISGNAPVSKFVSYSGAGSSHLVNDAFQAGSISICRKTDESAQSSRIIINSAGRPRTVREMLTSCP